MSFKNPEIQQIHFVSAKNNTFIEPKLRVRNYNSDWVFILLCLSVALFAFISTVYNKRVHQLIKAFWANRYSSELVKSENVLVKQASILLSVLFLLSFSLFSYQLLVFYYASILPVKGLKLYFLIMFSVLAFYAAKLILFRFLASVFNCIDETKEYSFNVFLINQTIGLFLLPLVALLNYVNVKNHAYLLFTGLLIIFGFFLFRIIKGLLTLWLGGVFSKSYLFLYLCALEILPLVVIGKLISTKYQL